MRLILFTGKGGVGKSSLAAATAVLSARGGTKTLLVSSDLAHNLADIFQLHFSEGTVEACDNLWLLEVNVLREIRDHWEPVQDYIAQFLTYLGMQSVIAEEVALIPGMDELLVLTRIQREVESGWFDTVIIDCAPTGTMLQVLTMTDSSSQKFNRLLKLERNILKLIRPVGRKIRGVKEILPEDEVYQSLGKLVENIGRLGEWLKDPQVCSIRLVLNPDSIAVAETRRAFTYLSLFGFPVDAIFVNKVFPDELSSGYFAQLCQSQQQELQTIEKSFLTTKIFQIRHLESSPMGLDSLMKLGKEIYGKENPGQCFSTCHPVTFDKEGDHVLLTFVLPGLDKTNLNIEQKENDLIITAGDHFRILQLPDSLVGREITGAKYKNNQLVVHFGCKP